MAMFDEDQSAQVELRIRSIRCRWSEQGRRHVRDERARQYMYFVFYLDIDTRTPGAHTRAPWVVPSSWRGQWSPAMHLVVSASAIAVIATSAAGSAKHALHLLEAHALNDDDAWACYHGVEEPLDEKEEVSDEFLKCQWMSYRSPVMPRWMGWGSGEDVILFGLHRLGMLAHHSAAAHHGTAPIDHSDLIRARVLERHEDSVCSRP